MLAEHNMPLSAFEALMHITHAEPGAISISELAERVRLSPSQVSRIAIDLERTGLVQRQRSATDSRSTEVAVTDAGRARLQAAAPTSATTPRRYACVEPS
jgi:DNA-binding MarR family transcriptional regulator